MYWLICNLIKYQREVKLKYRTESIELSLLCEQWISNQFRSHVHCTCSAKQPIKYCWKYFDFRYRFLLENVVWVLKQTLCMHVIMSATELIVVYFFQYEYPPNSVDCIHTRLSDQYNPWKLKQKTVGKERFQAKMVV